MNVNTVSDVVIVDNYMAPLVQCTRVGCPMPREFNRSYCGIEAICEANKAASQAIGESEDYWAIPVNIQTSVVMSNNGSRHVVDAVRTKRYIVSKDSPVNGMNGLSSLERANQLVAYEVKGQVLKLDGCGSLLGKRERDLFILSQVYRAYESFVMNDSYQ
jgi:hypothetical protein